MTASRPTLNQSAEATALAVVERDVRSEEIADPPPVVIEDRGPTLRTDLRRAWQERGLIGPLGGRVLASRISGTKLGRLWLVIRPFMASVGMALIFGGVLGVPTPNGIPYLVFFMTGMVCWRGFERFVFYSTRAFDFYRKLAKTFDVPLLLIPLAAGSYPAVEVAVYVSILIVSVAFYLLRDGVMYLQFGPELLVAAAGFALALSMGLGISLWTSVLNAKARDTRLTMRYVLEFWLYLTPVIYPLSAIPATYQRIAEVNPMTAPVEMFKYGLLGVGQVPYGLLTYSLGFTAVMLLSGLWFFNREAYRSVDVLEDAEDS